MYQIFFFSLSECDVVLFVSCCGVRLVYIERSASVNHTDSINDLDVNVADPKI